MQEWQRYKVSVPEGESQDWTVTRFPITQAQVEFATLRAMANPQRSPRLPVAGIYTGLFMGANNPQGSGIMMSDTPAEIEDHRQVIEQIEAGAKTVLIHGLGIGMVLQAALQAESVTHVCVVEIDQQVIDLVGPHYHEMAEANGKVLFIVQGDARVERKTPPKCADNPDRWDVVWHDIWPTISQDHLSQMALMRSRFAPIARWQGCWAEDECEAQAERVSSGKGWY